MDGLFQWMNRRVVDSTVQPVQSAVDQWLEAHWLVNVLVHHPLLLFGLCLLLIFLVSGALRAISRTSESLWILVLKWPFRVLGWLGFRSLAWWRKSRRDESGGRLQELLTRLEVLREEQDAIIAEVKTLVQKQPQNKVSAKMLQRAIDNDGTPATSTDLLSKQPIKS